MAEASYHRTRGGAAGWWLSGDIAPADCMAAYQAKGAASYAASLVNLHNPGTYDLYGGSDPAWTTDGGWDFSGGDYYKKAGLILASGGSAIVRFSDGTTKDGRLLCGTYKTTGDEFKFQPSADRFGVDYLRYTRAEKIVGLNSGVLATAGQNHYRNGSFDVSGLAWGCTTEMYIGAQNHHFNGPSAATNAKIQAIAFYSGTLTGDQISALTTAMNAL